MPVVNIRVVEDWLANADLTYVDANLFANLSIPSDLVRMSKAGIRALRIEGEADDFVRTRIGEEIAAVQFFIGSERRRAEKEQPVVLKTKPSATIGFALELVKNIHDENARNWGFEYVSNALADQGCFDQALELTTKIEKDDRSKTMCSRAVGYLAAAQAKQGRLKQALETADLIENEEARATALCAVVASQMGNYESALVEEALEEALDSARGIDFELIRATRLLDIANLQLLGNNLRGASEIAHEVVHAAEGLSRERWAVEPLTRAAVILAKTGSLKAAEWNLTRTLDVAKADEDGYYEAEGVQSVVRAWLEIGDVERALEVVSGIAWNYDRARALAIVALNVFDNGDEGRAIRTAGEIPETEARVNTLVSIAARYAARGQVDAVQSTLDLLEQGLTKDAGLIGIARALADVNRLDAAQRLVDSMSSPDNAAKAWLEIARALVGPKERGRALTAAISAIDKVDDAKKRSGLLWRSLCCKAAFEDRSSVLQDMKQLWWAIEGRDRSLREIAEALAQRGFVQEALDAADRIPLGRYELGRERALAVACIAREIAGFTAAVR